MNKNKSLDIKRILSFLIAFCMVIIPFGSFFVINAQADSTSLDIEGVELNGATVVTEGNKYLNTTSYLINGDNRYRISNAYKKEPALSLNGDPTPYVSFFIDTLGEGGKLLKGKDQKNGFDAYGFVAGTGEENANGEKESIAIKLKYNYNKTTGLTGTDGLTWDIANDSWKKTVNDMSSVGVIGKGAVIVQKFVPTEEKSHPTSADDWKRLNEFSGEETDGIHTVNFFEEYSPETRTEPFSIYTPSGSDLQKGVYVKLTVVYELEITEQTGWWIFEETKVKASKNVVEETVFYLCNTSAEVVFTNLYFDASEGSSEDKAPSQETGFEMKGGAISERQGAKEGFRVDIDGWNYDVTYRFNESTNALPVEDGQVFLDTGRYDFVIKTGIGVVKEKTVYVHEKTNEKNIEAYFGKGLVSSNSTRVFAPSEAYPVYLKDTVTLKTQDENAGLIKHAPLVGRVYCIGWQDWEDVKRDEKTNLPLTGLISEKKATDYAWSLGNLPVGNYEAVFYNNEDYFDGNATGDTYKFVWRFTIVEKGIAPSINEQALYDNVSINDLQSKHYVAILPSLGEGRVLCAFAEYESAYYFACKYFASKVTDFETAFTFEGITYQSEDDMLAVLRERAKSIVEERFFDLTDISTFVTIEYDLTNPTLDENPSEDELKELEQFKGVLEREYKQDVVVFASKNDRNEMVAGYPFLNDRTVVYINDDGEIKIEKKPVYFVSVADFETQKVILSHQESGISYQIPFGVAVEAYLEERNAPSGFYDIYEKNDCGSNEYEAVYIRKGDIKTSVTIQREYNNALITQDLDKRDVGTRLRANNFKITSIENELDEFGIIKIKKNNSLLGTYQITDYEQIPVIDEEGNYEIILIDRVGNQTSFYVDIYTAKKSYKLSLINGENTIFSEIAIGGKEFDLPTLEAPAENLVFIGWMDEDGNIFNDTYVFNSPKDINLKAVYHYSSVEVNVYDGGRIETLRGNVGKTLTLPRVTKDGYVLFGYRYYLEDGTILFYRDQITSVPNIESMDLEAVWIKAEKELELEAGRGDNVQISLVDGDLYTTITIEKGDKISLPSLDDTADMKFIGWIYEYQLTGMIFEGDFAYNDALKIGMVDENAIKLVSAWQKSENGAGVVGTTSTQNGSNGGITSTNKVTNGEGSLLDGVFTFFEGNVAFSISILALAMLSLVYALRGRIKAFALLIARKTVLLCHKIKEQRLQRELVATMNAQAECSRPRRKSLGARAISFISLVLCVIMLLSSQMPLVSHGATVLNEKIDEYNLEKECEQRAEQISTIIDQTEEMTDKELSETEEFLYSSLFVDLLAMGYEDIFFARAIVGSNTAATDDDKEIFGLGYTAYADAYEENDGVIFGAGFLSLPENGVITSDDAQNGVYIVIDDYAIDLYEYTRFKLDANVTIAPSHYVAYETYVFYQASERLVQYTATPDTGVYLDIYGDVFSYDEGDYCHFSNYDSEFLLDATSLDGTIDYEVFKRTYQETLELQLSNGIDIQVEKMDFISEQAINDYIAHDQDETFLGVDAETLMYYEANINAGVYYAIGKDGTVHVLELPDDPLRQATVWERIAVGATALGVAIAGIVLCVVGTATQVVGVGVGLGALGGAMLAAAVDIFVQVTINKTALENIDWVSVAINATSGAVSGAISGGVGAAATAAKATAATAAKITAKTVIKQIAISMGVGAVTGFFSGAISYFGNLMLKNEGKGFEFQDCLKAVGTSVLIGIIAAGVAGAVSSATYSWVTVAYVLVQAVTGGIIGAASYLVALGINGGEFDWKQLLLSVGLSVAISTLYATVDRTLGQHIRFKKADKERIEKAIERLPNDDNPNIKYEKKLPSGKWVESSKKELQANPKQITRIIKQDTKQTIDIIDGYPQLGEHSHSKLFFEDGITPDMQKNYSMFDKRQAAEWRKNPASIPKKVAEYFKTNGIDVKNLKQTDIAMLHKKVENGGLGLTWHEAEDGHTAYLVDSSLHEAVRHSGGRSFVKDISNGKYGNVTVALRKFKLKTQIDYLRAKGI